MKIILIAALDKGRVIGSEGSIPWNIQEDLNYFKEKTTNKAIIMGRKTFESIGRPLPNRLNIVMTRSKEKIDDVIIAPIILLYVKHTQWVQRNRSLAVPIRLNHTAAS